MCVCDVEGQVSKGPDVSYVAVGSPRKKRLQGLEGLVSNGPEEGYCSYCMDAAIVIGPRTNSP